MTITLTADEFQVAWEVMGFASSLPPVLRTQLHRLEGTDQQRAHAVDTALGQLRTKSLANAQGLGPELADALAILTNPRWVIDARLIAGYTEATQAARASVRARAAAGQDDALIVALTGDQVTITPSTPYRLPTDLVALAGDVNAGDSRSINLPAGTLLTAIEHSHGDRDQLIQELTDRGVGRGDASTIATITTTTLRHGQFDIAIAEDSTLHSVPGLIGFCDTPRGRWAQLRATDNDQDWLTITPADADQLANMIDSRLTAAHAARREL